MITALSWRLSALFGLLVLAALPLAAQPVKTPYVEAELVAEHATVPPGKRTTVALRLRHAEGWHTYWQNPGDSGLPTTLKWSLPEGYAAGPIRWTFPEAIAVGPLVNFGYEGEVFHLVEVDVPPTADPGTTAELAARADWLVCREICIPDGADLRLALPVAADAGGRGKWGAAIAAAREKLPRVLPADWRVSADGSGSTVALKIAPPAGTTFDPAQARFFPATEGRIEASGRQTVQSEGSGGVFLLPVASQLVGEFRRVEGVLVNPAGWGRPDLGLAVAVDVPLAGTVVAGAAPGQVSAGSPVPGAVALQTAQTSSLSLSVAMLFAFVGGIILNLMPCVFPVLSLKVLGFASHTELRGALWGKGVAFAVGAVVAFWALAGLLIALKAAGQELGWGFQLQSPAVIASLALLFFVLALNLTGMFEFGQFVPGSVAAWQSRKPLLDAFASGLLAVVIASPCTAPFMGAALGYALSQSAATTLAVFTALGLGMALPFLLLSVFPAWRRWLPKPGPWMVRMRQLLAFPLFATVIWLAWVLGLQLDVDAVLRLLIVLLIVALAIWLLRGQGGARGGWGGGFGLAALAAAAFVAWPLYAGSSAVASPGKPGARASSVEQGPWEPYSAQRIAEITAGGKAVFVDFTAAWCVTCQVNKQLVLHKESVLSAFRERGVTLMQADWTRQDPEVTRALNALGRSGVPVYALFRPGRQPLLLPEVLQESIIRDALASL